MVLAFRKLQFVADAAFDAGFPVRQRPPPSTNSGPPPRHTRVFARTRQLRTRVRLPAVARAGAADLSRMALSLNRKTTAGLRL